MPEQVVIEWSRDRIRVLDVELHGRRFEIRHRAMRELTQHVEMATPAVSVGQEIRGWLEAVGIVTSSAFVVLPREAVVIRRLQLPGAPEDELPDLVRFQAATKASTAIEQLVLDYLVLPTTDPSQGIPVNTFSLDRDQLARLTAVLEAAGVTIAGVTTSPLTVARLVRHSGHPVLGMPQPEMIVFQAGNRIEINIFDQGTLALSHGTQAPAEDRLRILKTELSRLLVTLTQWKPGAEIGRCYLIGDDPDRSMRTLLSERFQDRFEQPNLGALLESGEIDGFEPLLGACVPEFDERLHIDFVAPRKRRVVRDRRRLYWGIGTALTLLLLAAGYLVFQSKMAALESSIASLVDRELDLDKQLKSGEPRTIAHGRVAAWESSHVDPIAVWTALQAQLPGTDRIYFTEFKITPQKGEAVALFTGTGQSRQRRDVEEMYQKLAENGFRVTPTPTRSNTRDPDYPIQFDLNVLLLRRNGTPAEPSERAPGRQRPGGTVRSSTAAAT